MPNLDGTGPMGQGPVTGAGRGVGRGAGRGAGRGRGLGRAKTGVGRGLGGTKECTCPKCGYKEPHVRGTPCTQKKCPKCGTAMRGIFCL
ncbi:DUF5320 family protein [Candidatus Dojkabacteria bacterium]|nr:DUF5320 family protein [Candidatus Dojkabacteria bacterium]